MAGRIQALVELLFPNRCLFCRAALPTGRNPVCDRCGAGLPRVPGGTLFAVEDTHCAAPFYYEGPTRTLMHWYKFRGRHALSAYMAHRMEAALPPGWPGQVDVVSWVPVSAARRRKRGYDQSELLARALAKRLWCPCVGLLTKVRDAETQNALHTRSARRQNVADAFCAIPNAAAKKRILLVDDVMTSGATLRECVRGLQQAGAARVFCVVFSKTRRSLPE